MQLGIQSAEQCIARRIVAAFSGIDERSNCRLLQMKNAPEHLAGVVGNRKIEQHQKLAVTQREVPDIYKPIGW